MNFEHNRNVKNVCVHQLNHNIDHHLVQVTIIELEEFSKVTRPMDLGPSTKRFYKSWFWEFLVNISLKPLFNKEGNQRTHGCKVSSFLTKAWRLSFIVHISWPNSNVWVYNSVPLQNNVWV
jgi:hypothetical protein